MHLTEDPIGEANPQKKKYRGVLVAFFALTLISFFIFVPGSPDFFRAAGSIFSRSLSDTFHPSQFGKPAVEIDLQAEHFPAEKNFSGSGERKSGIGNTPDVLSAPTFKKQNPTVKTINPKTQKDYEDQKSADTNIPSYKPAEIISPSGFGSSTGATSSVAVPKNILIAEVQIAGASTTNDVVKIYNRGTVGADIGGWKLKKKTNSGKEYSIRVFPDGSLIPARGIFLWANSQNNFSASVGANVSSAETISSDNSIALIVPDGAIMDAVAWGSSTRPYVEGFPYPTNPGARKILARKFSGGEMQDTNNNLADFEIR